MNRRQRNHTKVLFLLLVFAVTSMSPLEAKAATSVTWVCNQVFLKYFAKKIKKQNYTTNNPYSHILDPAKKNSSYTVNGVMFGIPYCNSSCQSAINEQRSYNSTYTYSGAVLQKFSSGNKLTITCGMGFSGYKRVKIIGILLKSGFDSCTASYGKATCTTTAPVTQCTYANKKYAYGRKVCQKGYVYTCLTTGTWSKTSTKCDPTCSKGIIGGGVCCRSSCGKCGGSGCSKSPGGAKSCCVGSIKSSKLYCSTNAAPCILQ